MRFHLFSAMRTALFLWLALSACLPPATLNLCVSESGHVAIEPEGAACTAGLTMAAPSSQLPALGAADCGACRDIPVMGHFSVRMRPESLAAHAHLMACVEVATDLSLRAPRTSALPPTAWAQASSSSSPLLVTLRC